MIPGMAVDGCGPVNITRPVRPRCATTASASARASPGADHAQLPVAAQLAQRVQQHEDALGGDQPADEARSRSGRPAGWPPA